MYIENTFKDCKKENYWFFLNDSIQETAHFVDVQLNDYETDSYLLQLSQNIATNCLFTFVFFPVLT
jgi:hypothetical protein